MFRNVISLAYSCLAIQDYLSLNPESIHQVMILFSDRGTPNGYSHMHGYSGHTLKLVNKNGDYVYTQIHFRVRGGFQTLNNEEAGKLAGENPDYGIELFREEIDKGNYPTWDVYVVRAPS
jgi:catalase